MIHDTKKAEILQTRDERNTLERKQCAVPVTSYHKNGLVATHALRHMMYIISI